MGLISVQAANPTATATAAAAFTMLAHFIKRSPWVVDSKFRRRSPRATASNLQRECNSKHAACLLIATVISVSDAGVFAAAAGRVTLQFPAVASRVWLTGAARRKLLR